MPEFVRPVAAVLGIASLAALMAIASTGGALAQAKQAPQMAPAQAAPPQPPAVKQMALTDAQLEGVAKKNGFAGYDEYNNIIDNISIVLAGFDPATKKYVGTETVIKAQIAQVQANKKMSAKDKKEGLAEPTDALKS